MGGEADLLPELDIDFLEEKGYSYTAAKVGGEVHLIIRDYDFPPAYALRKADLLIILPAGYPNAHPDMFWTHPDVKLVNGRWPVNSDQHQVHEGRSWQRWSRHHQGKWRAGIDSLRNYLAAVRVEVDKGI